MKNCYQCWSELECITDWLTRLNCYGNCSIVNRTFSIVINISMIVKYSLLPTSVNVCKIVLSFCYNVYLYIIDFNDVEELWGFKEQFDMHVTHTCSFFTASSVLCFSRLFCRRLRMCISLIIAARRITASLVDWNQQEISNECANMVDTPVHIFM